MGTEVSLKDHRGSKGTPALAGAAQAVEPVLCSEGLPVKFLIRPHAPVVGSVPALGCMRQPIDASSSHRCFSLPPSPNLNGYLAAQFMENRGQPPPRTGLVPVGFLSGTRHALPCSFLRAVLTSAHATSSALPYPRPSLQKLPPHQQTGAAIFHPKTATT